jgi:hypothetical protein
LVAKTIAGKETVSEIFSNLRFRVAVMMYPQFRLGERHGERMYLTVVLG